MDRLRQVALTACVLLLAVGLQVQAQVDARLRLDHTQFLQFEPVTGELSVRNLSGKSLEIKPEQFNFLVKFDQNRYVPRLGNPVLSKPIILAAGESVTKRINFSKSFKIREQGPYTFGGRLNFYGQKINMAYAYTDIVPGIVVKELQSVVGNGDQSAVRTFRLLTIYRNKNQHIFLWIEDPAKGLSYGVYDLGPLLSVGVPRLEVGENDQVHVLHRSTPSQYVHSVFTMNGTPIDKVVFDSDSGQPSMQRAVSGDLSVRVGLDEDGEESRIRAFTLDGE